MQNRHMDQLLDLLEENRSLITIIYSITNTQLKFNFYLINYPLCAKLVTSLDVETLGLLQCYVIITFQSPNLKEMFLLHNVMNVLLP